MDHDTKIIAVAGKGGVGKTSVSAAMVKLLVKEYPDARILAIDADPAIGLSTALGVEVTHTLDGIRKSVALDVTEKQRKDVENILGEVKFQLFDAMVEQDGFAFLAIGRPEEAGCYCAINTYLRKVISMIAQDFDYVVIDGEAGIEQINRRVMEKVTHLLLISDPSKKGTQVIQTIRKVADELTMYSKSGVIINRLADESLKECIDTGDIPVLTYIKDDKELAKADAMGESVLGLSEDARIMQGVKEALQKLEVI